MKLFNIEETYKGTLIRPPSEADSLIFQVTLGCTDNNCIFCPAYKDKPFKVKDLSEIFSEITCAAEVYPDTRKIFLADGDALSLPVKTLKTILDACLKVFPNLSRVSAYGSIKSLENKSIEDLKSLKELKLGLVYLGFETGDDEVYGFIRKYGSPDKNVETCLKLKAAGIKTNVTVILGLGGKKYSNQHALNTAKILNLAQPHQIAALTLMIAPNTPLYQMIKSGEFEELDSFEYLKEMFNIIQNMADFRCLFFSNHASNYYPVNARFPKDKSTILNDLKKVIKSNKKSYLKPEFLRGL